jgi:hypothetical protein
MPDRRKTRDAHCANPARRELFTRGFPALAALAVTAAGCTYDMGRPKVPKAQAQYREAPLGQQACGNCRHYIAASSTCRIVEGPISPNGWSRYWEPRTGPRIG